MTTDTPSSKPWFQKKRYIIAMVLVVLAIIGQFTGSSEPEAPATLAISDIKDMSGFDEENNEYYWGATFRITELEPTTKVNCTVKAIDANGGVLIVWLFALFGGLYTASLYLSRNPELIAALFARQ